MAFTILILVDSIDLLKCDCYLNVLVGNLVSTQFVWTVMDKSFHFFLPQKQYCFHNQRWTVPGSMVPGFGSRIRFSGPVPKIKIDDTGSFLPGPVPNPVLGSGF